MVKLSRIPCKNSIASAGYGEASSHDFYPPCVVAQYWFRGSRFLCSIVMFFLWAHDSIETCSSWLWWTTYRVCQLLCHLSDILTLLLSCSAQCVVPSFCSNVEVVLTSFQMMILVENVSCMKILAGKSWVSTRWMHGEHFLTSLAPHSEATSETTGECVAYLDPCSNHDGSLLPFRVVVTYVSFRLFGGAWDNQPWIPQVCQAVGTHTYDTFEISVAENKSRGQVWIPWYCMMPMAATDSSRRNRNYVTISYNIRTLFHVISRLPATHIYL